MKQISLCLLMLAMLLSCSNQIKNKKERNEHKRIIVLGQSAVELLLALGMQDSIVGMAYFDNMDDFINSDLPILTTHWPEKESILALNPNLIFSMEAAFREDRIGAISFWKDRGIDIFIIDDYRESKCFDRFFNDLERVGTFLKKEAITDSISQSIQSYINDAQKQRRTNGKVLFLASLANDSYYYYPPSLCLLDEVIEHCGGSYINLGEKSFVLSIEAILKANPDKIIVSYFRNVDKDSALNNLYNHPHLKQMKAIKEKQVLSINYTNAIRGSMNMREVYFSVSSFLSVEK